MDTILELTTQTLCEDAREDKEKLGLFGELDKNMDGSLSVEEFKPFAKSQGVEVDDKAALQIFFNLFDANKDGVVSQGEFFAWFAKKEEEKEVIKNADDAERLTRGAFTQYLLTLSLPWLVLLGYQKVGAGKKPKNEPNMFDPTQLKDKPLETAFTETTFEAVTKEMYNQDYTDTTEEAVAEKQKKIYDEDVKAAVKTRTAEAEKKTDAPPADAPKPKKKQAAPAPEAAAPAAGDKKADAPAAGIGIGNARPGIGNADAPDLNWRSNKQKKITATKEQTKKELREVTKTAATPTAEQTETAATAAEQKKLAATAAFGAAALAGAYSAATRGKGLEAEAEITKPNGSADSDDIKENIPLKQALEAKVEEITKTNGSADSDDIKEDTPLKLPKIELPNAGSTLPSGWSKATDPSSGNTYYYNEKGETQWDVPN